MSLSSSLLVSRMGTLWARGHVPGEKRQVCPWHLGPQGVGIRLLGGRWIDGPPPSLLQAPVALATLLGGAGLQQLYQARWDHTRAEVVGSRGRPGRPGREDVPRVSFSASAISFSGIHAGEGNHETGWIRTKCSPRALSDLLLTDKEMQHLEKKKRKYLLRCAWGLKISKYTGKPHTPPHPAPCPTRPNLKVQFADEGKRLSQRRKGVMGLQAHQPMETVNVRQDSLTPGVAFGQIQNMSSTLPGRRHRLWVQ